VSAGDRLARLDDTDLQARLQEARAALEAAEAGLKEARQEYQRTKRLFDRGSASERQMDKASAGLSKARAQKSQAQARIRKLAIRLDKTTIRAPFDGVVVARPIEKGELARPGKPVITVLSSRHLRLVAHVQESRIPRLLADGSGRVRVPALGETFDAERVTVVPKGDPGTHTFRVRLRLPDGAAASPGMFGRALFRTGTVEALVAPERAIVRRSEITGVYVVADGRVSFRLVELGEPAGDGREILAGLQAGERIALDPDRALRYLKESRPQADSAQAH
jgi:RND family efflux transporter MFP subunit